MSSVNQPAVTEFTKDRLTVSDIISGRLTKMPEIEVGKVLPFSTSLVTALCSELTTPVEAIKVKNGENWRKSHDFKKWLVEADTFIGFAMDNFSPEMCVMSVRDAVVFHKLPLNAYKMKNFAAFSVKYRHMIMPD